MKNNYNDETTIMVIVVALITFFFSLWLMDTYNVKPLKEEAIKRGYASYTITNSTHQTTSQFTWK